MHMSRYMYGCGEKSEDRNLKKKRKGESAVYQKKKDIHSLAFASVIMS